VDFTATTSINISIVANSTAFLLSIYPPHSNTDRFIPTNTPHKKKKRSVRRCEMEEGSELPPANPEPAAGATEFTFVLDQNQHGVRSHAMREYWRRRHKRSRSLEKRSTPHRHRHLLPNKSDQSRSSSSQSDSDAASRSASALPAEEAYNLEHILFSHQQQRPRSQFDVTGHQPAGRRHASIEDMTVLTGGIPAQVLAGVNRALACSRLDPFDMFPVKLTAQHHRLLHHCELP